MNKLGKRTLLMLVATALIVSLVPAISFAAITTNTEKTDTGSIKIASKAKTASYKVTWNGNGGKIGTKTATTTTVNKGKKIGKFPTTPKRSGYTFQGWYTKKNGGTKITKNTKPKNSVTYYAKWKKGSSTSNTNTKSKLIGSWHYSLAGDTNTYYFRVDGTFSYIRVFLYGGYSPSSSLTKGKYEDINGKIYFKNIVADVGTPSEHGLKNTVHEYKLGKDTNGEYLLIPSFAYPDKAYVDIYYAQKYRK